MFFYKEVINCVIKLNWLSLTCWYWNWKFSYVRSLTLCVCLHNYALCPPTYM